MCKKTSNNSASVQEHVNAKFANFARTMDCELIGEPRFCKVIFKGKNNKDAEHMTCEALGYPKKHEKHPKHEKVHGYVVNQADKELKFYSADEIIIVHPLPTGTPVEKVQRGRRRKISNPHL